MQYRLSTHAGVPQGQGPVFGTAKGALMQFPDETIPGAQTLAQLVSGALQPSVVATLKGIAAAQFAITINGTVHQIGPMNLTTVTSFTDVATAINTAVAAAAAGSTCVYAVPNLLISAPAAVGGAITFASAPSGGTDVSATLCLTSATGAVILT